jgi:hypothetical protein
MAELLECLLCGYKTVRCGMTNHLKKKHQKEYFSYLEKYHAASRDARIEDPKELTKPLGKVIHWSKNRQQSPV